MSTLKISRQLKIVVAASILGILTAGIALAGFLDKGQVLGSKFSVGSADIKLMIDPSGLPDQTNLADELTGPSFDNIGPNWTSDYLVKLFNNGTGTVELASNSDYETANDPDDLRQIIFVEPIEWDDINSDGVVDVGEEGVSLGRKTIVKWKTEGFDLGSLESGQIKSLILRFSTDSVADSKQGTTGLFDFVFDSIQVE